MSSKTKEELETINDLLATCRRGRPWDLSKKPFYFVNLHARIAVVIGGVKIDRVAQNTWEIKSKTVQPKEKQWRMANTYFERMEQGRQVSRLMQELHLYQPVDPEVLYVQYLNKDLRQANRITKEKGKTSAAELLKVGATVWFCQGTTKFFKMIREDETTWLKITIDIDLHRWITTWGDFAYVKWSKVVNETETGRLRVTVQAIGDPSVSGTGCGAEVCEDVDGAGMPELEIVKGAGATSPKRMAEEEVGPNKLLKATKVEPVEDAAGVHVTCPACGFARNPGVAGHICEVCNGAGSQPEEVDGQTTPIKSEVTPVKCDGCNNLYSSREVENIHICEPLGALEREIDKTVKLVRPMYMSPEGSKVLRRLFPGLDDTPARMPPKPKFKNGKQTGLVGTLAMARAPLTMSMTKKIRVATQEEIEDCGSAEESDTDDTVTVIPPTQEDDEKDLKCGICSVYFTEALGIHELSRKERNVSCDGCQDYFYREPTAECIMLHSGDEWVLKHCNECHDKLDKKYKDFDWDRNTCDKCRDVARENEDESECYDHGAGEIDIVHMFQKKVRTISLRSMSNARTLEGISEGVGSLEDRMVNIEATLKKIQEGIVAVQRALASGDVNGNKIVLPGESAVPPINRASKQPMGGVIQKDQESNGNNANSSTENRGAEPMLGFSNRDETTLNENAQKVEDAK